MIIEANYFGTSTSRNLCCVQHTPYLIDLPLNTNITRVDAKTGSIVMNQQVHTDCLTLILTHPKLSNHILSLSYAGHIKLWRHDIEKEGIDSAYKLVSSDTITTKYPKLLFAVIDRTGQYFTTITKSEVDERSEICIFEICYLAGNQVDIALVTRFFDWYDFLVITNVDEEYIQLTGIYQPDMQKTDQTRFRRLNIRKSMDSDIELLDSVRMPDLCSLVYHMSFNNTEYHKSNGIAMLYTKQKAIYILNLDSFEILLNIPKGFPDSSPFIKYMTMCKGEDVYLAADDGRLAFWKLSFNDGKYAAEFQHFYAIPHGQVYFLEFPDYSKNKVVWLVNISGIHYFDLEYTDSYIETPVHIEYHELTCSGVSISDSNKYLASVDFKGQLFVWDLKDNSKYPLYKHRFYEPLRSVSIKQYKSSEYLIIVGSLEGKLYRLHLDIGLNKVEASKCEVVCYLKGSIITMSWSRPIIYTVYPKKKERNLLAIGTSNGYLSLFELSLQREFEIEFVVLAHKAVTEYKDPRFGSLCKYAEIWSICFSPCNDYIASASEDQTTVIWSLQGEKIHTFVGHATAVTSVDWQYSPMINKELLITCADDKKVIVWVLNELEFCYKRKWILYTVIDTLNLGLDWHTLTYIRIERDPSRLRVVFTAQNGFIFVYDILKQKMLFAKKVHCGSIEGLEATYDDKSGFFVTCSSDCTVGVFRLAE